MAIAVLGAGLVGLALLVVFFETFLNHRRERFKLACTARRHRTPAVLGEAVAANRITSQDARTVIDALSKSEAIAAGLANTADLDGLAKVIQAMDHPDGPILPA